MARPPLDDAAALRAWRDQTLYRLLLRASRAETTMTLDHLRRQGYTDISLADASLLANLDTDGTTISALARRAGITRQAVSQQAVALERSGYIQRRPSDTDARAVTITHTARGRALLDHALDTVDHLETTFAGHLGQAGLASLKESLALLLDRIDPAGTLGRE